MKRLLFFSCLLYLTTFSEAQEAERAQRPPGGPGPGGGGGGFGGGPRQEKKLVPQFDKDGDKRLNAEERKAAREFLQKEIAEGRGQRRGGGPRGGNQNFEAKPGPKLTAADVKKYGSEPLYDIKTLRTLFFEFEECGLVEGTLGVQ